MKTRTQPTDAGTSQRLPTLLTTAEVAELLRTSRKAVWSMIERGQLPGVVRIGRRILIQQAAMIDWLGQKSQVVVSKGMTT
jgi:excisionase family DNA binding protein